MRTGLANMGTSGHLGICHDYIGRYFGYSIWLDPLVRPVHSRADRNQDILDYCRRCWARILACRNGRDADEIRMRIVALRSKNLASSRSG